MKALLACLFLLLSCTPALRAVDEPSTIPFSEIGAKATADYKGEAIGITATEGGATLRAGFQKLAGTVTQQGLSLESTDAKGGSPWSAL